ncbi:type VI secretion system protein TssA [Aquisalimonas sp.]|uniref:type VI secretion system protein TssA n=1 Tax=Aquisalimonas sp. TaxID=1872621 RepID=UPI0025BA701A|nr:type VI secretion system protein TssA [Aquisalimonas sp.]
MELDRILEPLSNDAPADVDLDAGGEILALDMLAQWGYPEREPDWRELQRSCLEALEKSRDLRPGAYLAAALLHTEGLSGFADGVHCLRQLVESQWDAVHPPLDEDGDATERANALFNLTNYQKVLKPLRRVPLVDDRATGRFSLLDIEIADGKADVPEGYEGDPPRRELIEAAFEAVGNDALQALASPVKRAVDDLAAIEAVFRDRCGVEQAPDLARLRDVLGRIDGALQAFMPAPDHAAPEPPLADASADRQGNPGPSGVASESARAPGEIRTRAEAVAAMDAIATYFRTQEPSSPVPLLIERAKRLVDMDFVSILRDVAPDAVDQVKKLRGADPEE